MVNWELMNCQLLMTIGDVWMHEFRVRIDNYCSN